MRSFFVISLVAFTCPLFLFSKNPTAKASPDMAQTVQAFLNELDKDQLVAVQYSYEDEERYNWHYVPRDRKGLPFKSMNNRQREAAKKVLQLGLSNEGYQKATSIIALENVLRDVENRGPDDKHRDPENYSFTIFGKPSNKTPWGWRIEGHHLSLNFSSVSNKIIAGAPAFLGANPAVVLDGAKKGWQVLKQEEDLARNVLSTLDSNQLQKAIILDEAPADIITKNDKRVQIGSPQGLSAAKMREKQKALLMQLIALYLHNYEEEYSASFTKRIREAGIDNLYFAWAGSTVKSQGALHYYRIHGPNILIEYDNTQNKGNHVHAVVRDLENDFGGDQLKKHYDEGHEK